MKTRIVPLLVFARFTGEWEPKVSFSNHGHVCVIDSVQWHMRRSTSLWQMKEIWRLYRDATRILASEGNAPHVKSILRRHLEREGGWA